VAGQSDAVLAGFEAMIARGHSLTRLVARAGYYRFISTNAVRVQPPGTPENRHSLLRAVLGDRKFPQSLQDRMSHSGPSE
jgi:hypothetical protein